MEQETTAQVFVSFFLLIMHTLAITNGLLAGRFFLRNPVYSVLFSISFLLYSMILPTFLNYNFTGFNVPKSGIIIFVIFLAVGVVIGILTEHSSKNPESNPESKNTNKGKSRDIRYLTPNNRLHYIAESVESKIAGALDLEEKKELLGKVRRIVQIITQLEKLPLPKVEVHEIENLLKNLYDAVVYYERIPREQRNKADREKLLTIFSLVEEKLTELLHFYTEVVKGKLEITEEFLKKKITSR